jgi:hypothetical protein
MSPGLSKPRTPLDDERLRSLKIAGMDAKEIATELERAVTAVRAHTEKSLGFVKAPLVETRAEG